MSNIVSDLELPVWRYFADIMKLARPSGNEAQMVEYLQRFAVEHGLEHHTDSAGNVLILKPSTCSEDEKAKTIVLQAHTDMVCVASAEATDNPALGQITPRIVADTDGKRWLSATNTTLGADDGIGVALCLAVLADNGIEHGPLACLFTTCEETGLNGAKNLTEAFLPGSYLINLDSEEENEICIGCAGGCTTKIRLSLGTEGAKTEGMLGIELEISGLLGGHSGSDIHLGRANAIKVMNKMVATLSDECDFRLSTMKGGCAHNAIPATCKAVGAVPFSQREAVRVAFNIAAAEMQSEFAEAEPQMHFWLGTTDVPVFFIKKEGQQALIKALNDCPHGPTEMAEELEDTVKTSTNLATIDIANGEAHIGTSQRSFSKQSKLALQQAVVKAFTECGCEAATEESEGYPAWQPKYNSALLTATSDVFAKHYKKKPTVRVIHAGLECGLMSELKPEMDMISIGPTMMDVHTPNERICIESVDEFWLCLLDILSRMAHQYQ